MQNNVAQTVHINNEPFKRERSFDIALIKQGPIAAQQWISAYLKDQSKLLETRSDAIVLLKKYVQYQYCINNFQLSKLQSSDPAIVEQALKNFSLDNIIESTRKASLESVLIIGNNKKTAQQQIQNMTIINIGREIVRGITDCIVFYDDMNTNLDDDFSLEMTWITLSIESKALQTHTNLNHYTAVHINNYQMLIKSIIEPFLDKDFDIRPDKMIKFKMTNEGCRAHYLCPYTSPECFSNLKQNIASIKKMQTKTGTTRANSAQSNVIDELERNIAIYEPLVKILLDRLENNSECEHFPTWFRLYKKIKQLGNEYDGLIKQYVNHANATFALYKQQNKNRNQVTNKQPKERQARAENSIKAISLDDKKEHREQARKTLPQVAASDTTDIVDEFSHIAIKNQQPSPSLTPAFNHILKHKKQSLINEIYDGEQIKHNELVHFIENNLGGKVKNNHGSKRKAIIGNNTVCFHQRHGRDRSNYVDPKVVQQIKSVLEILGIKPSTDLRVNKSKKNGKGRK